MRRLNPTRLPLLALAGSLLLHGGLLVLALLGPGHPRVRPAPRALVIDLSARGGELRAGDEAARPAASPAARAPRRGVAPTTGRRLERQEVPPPTTGAPGGTAQDETAAPASPGEGTGGTGHATGPTTGTPGFPRRIELLPRPVAPTPAREHAEQLRRMVDEPWRERGRELRLEQDLVDGRTTLAPMAQRLGQWFAPDPTPLLARAGGRLPPPRRPIDATDPSSLAVPRYSSDLEQVVSMLRFGSIPLQLQESPTAAKGLPAPPLYTVGDTAEVLAELAALVQVDHDDDGTPASWRLVESSGDAGFDREALAAVQDGLALGSKLVLRGDRKLAWSRWRFGAQLYWWRKDADPSFHPPGVPVDGGGPIGTRTVIRETKLVALGYRAPPPADGAGGDAPASAAP